MPTVDNFSIFSIQWHGRSFAIVFFKKNKWMEDEGQNAQLIAAVEKMNPWQHVRHLLALFFTFTLLISARYLKQLSTT